MRIACLLPGDIVYSDHLAHWRPQLIVEHVRLHLEYCDLVGSLYATVWTRGFRSQRPNVEVVPANQRVTLVERSANLPAKPTSANTIIVWKENK